jgi:hypothetical protein
MSVAFYCFVLLVVLLGVIVLSAVLAVPGEDDHAH